jgi:polysaccharide export outer membrane protein
MHFARSIWLALILLSSALSPAHAQVVRPYLLGAGDIIKISVFQNPDLGVETRVSDTGGITFPLVGALDITGLTVTQAEQKIAAALKSGGYVLRPQVNMVVSQFRSRQVSVLGNVQRPGRYSLEDQTLRLADVLSLAGGVTAYGGDNVLITRTKGGKEDKISVDLDAAFLYNDLDKNLEILPGDTIYVPRFPFFYIYGQVGRPGQFRLERNLTVMQAVAIGGGVTLRGTEKGIQIRRRDVGGKVETLNVGLQDRVMQDDVIYVRESVF